MRYFIRLAYNGAPFHGWQIQPNAISIQQTLEQALSTVLRTPTSVTGAGRTDTGVNAREMFAHFDTETPVADTGKLINALNRLCGRDIAIYDIFQVRSEAHARFDAVKRTYKYFVTFSKNPFLYPVSWHSPSGLDFDAMNHAADILLHTEDFTSFAKLHSDAKTNICQVTEAVWTPVSQSLTTQQQGCMPLSSFSSLFGPDDMVFTISADRFLRNMVRAVVGTLVDVGRGKISIGQFKDIITRRDRCAAGTSMPPQALFLWAVEYPQDIFPDSCLQSD